MDYSADDIQCSLDAPRKTQHSTLDYPGQRGFREEALLHKQLLPQHHVGSHWAQWTHRTLTGPVPSGSTCEKIRKDVKRCEKIV